MSRRRRLARAWSLDRIGVAWVGVALAAAVAAPAWPWWGGLAAAAHLAVAVVTVRVRVRRRLERRLGMAVLWTEGLGMWGRIMALYIGAALWGVAVRHEEARRASEEEP